MEDICQCLETFLVVAFGGHLAGKHQERCRARHTAEATPAGKACWPHRVRSDKAEGPVLSPPRLLVPPLVPVFPCSGNFCLASDNPFSFLDNEKT